MEYKSDQLNRTNYYLSKKIIKYKTKKEKVEMGAFGFFN